MKVRRARAVDRSSYSDPIVTKQIEEYNILAKGLADWRTANELEPVQVIQSVFVSLNRASQVGGIPFRCIHLYHGPKHGGKTLLAISDAISFERSDHLVVWVDSERTFSSKFYEDCGGDPSKIIVVRPKTYEECMNDVTKITGNFISGKKDGSIREETALLLVIDTITKLLPRNFQAAIAREEDLVKQLRIMGMTKALVNQCWLDQLTPLVGDNDIAVVLIAQERKKGADDSLTGDAKYNEPKRGGGKYEPVAGAEDFRVKGGDSLLFDTAFQVRISLSTLIREKVEGYEKEIVVGKRHKGIVVKNKVGFPDEVFYFFTSNGKGDIPVGLDYEREAVEECRQRGWLVTSGAWISIVRPKGDDEEDDSMLARSQGVYNLIKFLRENTEVYQIVVDSLNER